MPQPDWSWLGLPLFGALLTVMLYETIISPRREGKEYIKGYDKGHADGYGKGRVDQSHDEWRRSNMALHDLVMAPGILAARHGQLPDVTREWRQ